MNVQLDKSIVKIPSTPSEALDSLPKPMMESQNEILVNRVEMDETISPTHKALFKKDMTPGILSNQLSLSKENVSQA